MQACSGFFLLFKLKHTANAKLLFYPFSKNGRTQFYAEFCQICSIFRLTRVTILFYCTYCFTMEIELLFCITQGSGHFEFSLKLFVVVATWVWHFERLGWCGCHLNSLFRSFVAFFMSFFKHLRFYAQRERESERFGAQTRLTSFEINFIPTFVIQIYDCLY